MISVVIPTCDRPDEYLQQAIGSALDQTLSPAEVIVVDNGQQGVDPKALPENVDYHRLPPRVGASRARNYGATVARGSYLAFLDDDDWWDTNFLCESLAVLEAEGTSCVFSRKDVYRDGIVQPYKCPTADMITIPTLLKRNPGTGGQNVVVSKDLFLRIGGFAEHLRTANDKAFVLELLLAGEKISVAPKAIAIVRPHDGPRLDDEKLSRLRFVWQYRKLYGPLGAMRKVRGILRQYRLHRSRIRKNKKAGAGRDV